MNVIIDGISHQGEGVGRIQGKAVFVPFAIPGEEISIEIINEQKRFSRERSKKSSPRPRIGWKHLVSIFISAGAVPISM